MEEPGGLGGPALPRLKMAVAGQTCGVMSAEVAPSALEGWGGSGCEPSPRSTSSIRHQMVVGALARDPVQVRHVKGPIGTQRPRRLALTLFCLLLALSSCRRL
jgi:hypothetical protein